MLPENSSEADYVIFFNVVEFRRILNTILSLRRIVCDRQRFAGATKAAAHRLEGEEKCCLRTMRSAI